MADQQEKELSATRDRAGLSQQNWLKEKEELIQQESYLQSEFEQAKEAMHNWEVLAMEERSIRENLAEKIIDLEEQLAGLKDAYDKAASEHESQATTVDGLQRALQDIQTGTLVRREFRRAQSDELQPVDRNFVNSPKALILNLRILGGHLALQIRERRRPTKPSKPPKRSWRGCGRLRRK